MKLLCRQVLEGHQGRVWSCAWYPKGTLLATCGEDTKIRLWGKEQGSNSNWALKAILTEGHTRTVRSVAWSPCGRFLASASFDGTVAVWNRNEGEGNSQFECNATLEGHENEVKSVSWSPSGNFLATCSRDKSVWVWDIDEEEDGNGENEYMCAAVLQAHTQDVKMVRWHPNVDILASCSYDNKVKLFKEDGDEWVCSDTLSSHESTAWSLCFDSTGDRLASSSEDRTVKIWEKGKEGKWRCACTLSGYHERAVYHLDWCHQTGLLATAGGDNAICIFREESRSPGGETNFALVLSHAEAHSQDINCVAWNPVSEGLLLASCGDDGAVKLWEVQKEMDDD